MKINRYLNICLVSYRSNPHSGGQGVYLKNLARALTDLGHWVQVISGPPDPQLPSDIPIQHIPGLDLYNPADPFRIPTLQELSDPVNLLEWTGVSTMGFPEPFTFGLRAYHAIRNARQRFDVVHDNQSLSYGIWALKRVMPTLATIHHPITVDRNLAVKSVSAFWKKLKHMRWHSFLRMQKLVSRTLPRIVTVSECAKKDIAEDFRIPAQKFRVVPNGISTDLFYPIPDIQREKNRLIVTNSADIPLKGLYHLLHAVARIAQRQPIKLIVIGTPKKNGGIEHLIRTLGIGHLVKFTGRIDHDIFVRQYARASVAVVPSLYEGFGLPAGEAMACGVPVVSTTGGALPEVVGNAGILVPPGDDQALAAAIRDLLGDRSKANALGQKGYRRIQEHFTWKRAAQKTLDAYQEVIRDYR